MRAEVEAVREGQCLRRIRQYRPDDAPRMCVARAMWRVRSGTAAVSVCDRHLLDVLRSLSVAGPAEVEEGS